MSEKTEYLEVFDEATGRVVSLAPRSECHSDPRLLHRAVRVQIFHPDGKRVLLQKRSLRKAVQPGRWDAAVGGHVDPGEELEDAARREMVEELGLPRDLPLKFFYDIKVRNEIESENIRVFSAEWDGPLKPQESEVDAVEYFSIQELQKLHGGGSLTPLLARELVYLEKRVKMK